MIKTFLKILSGYETLRNNIVCKLLDVFVMDRPYEDDYGYELKDSYTYFTSRYRSLCNLEREKNKPKEPILLKPTYLNRGNLWTSDDDVYISGNDRDADQFKVFDLDKEEYIDNVVRANQTTGKYKQAIEVHGRFKKVTKDGNIQFVWQGEE